MSVLAPPPRRVFGSCTGTAAIHLVLGPSGSQKTGRAVQLARTLDAPVIAVDRVQVFDDLATTSGRPQAQELHGTTRVYLDRRLARCTPVELTASAAVDRLEVLIGRLGPPVILEGGSISAWRCFFDRPGPTPHPLKPRLRAVEDWAAQAEAMRARALQTMSSGRPSMLDELAAGLGNPRSRPLVRTLISVEDVLRWCNEQHLAPRTLSEYRDDRELTRALATAMTPALVAYAREQQIALAALLAGREAEIEVAR